MRSCDCADIILTWIPVVALVSLVREYASELDVDKINAAILRTRKFGFSNGLGAHIVIEYTKGYVYFSRSSNTGNNPTDRRISMCCLADRVPYLLQDPDMMDIVCSQMRESTRLKNYLAKLGSRLDKILRTCHVTSEECDN